MTRCGKFFTIMALGLSILLPSNASGKSSYKVIDKSKSTIQFEFDSTSLSDIKYQLKDWNSGYTLRKFYVGNNNSKRIGEKTWVAMWHYELGPNRHYQSSYNLREGLPDWGAFKNRQNIIIDQGKIDSSMTEYDFLIFNSDRSPCSLFSSTFGSDTFHMGSYVGTTRLSGALCLEKGQTITKTILTELVGSIQIKGHSGETTHRFSPPKNAEPVSQSSGTNAKILKKIQDNSDDQKRKLEKAKELFERDLISKGEYEELRKNILGLN